MRRWDDQHRACGGADHARGIRAEQQQIDCAAPVDAHDDEVGRLFSGQAKNLAVGSPLPDRRLDVTVGADRWRDQLAKANEAFRFGRGMALIDVEVGGYGNGLPKLGWDLD